ncbi:MAG: MoxR family ATPase [Syntrophomonadaceae bacterium]|jgi:MoxR-like ATPase|nr:MoxR family ATPase [Syntrophomonadaceae bacterium]
MEIENFRQVVQEIEEEIGRVMVGQQDIIRHTLICLLAGGNALLEGVPGLGKTMLVRTISRVLDLKFSRIQFTPDLMPADIVGTNIIAEDETGKKQFRFQPGPVFANIILADEINRATPKTQSAMLEAMQERTVTAGGETRELSRPFFVLATQNPLEMEGTYPLPEAQMDRFLFKLLVKFPAENELARIIELTTGSQLPEVRRVAGAETILDMSRLALEVPVAERVMNLAVRVVLATHPDSEYAPEQVKKFVRYGASPRGGQALIAASKVRALMEGRYNVAFEDIEELAYPALRHRFFLNFEGEAEGLTTDDLITEVLSSLRTVDN